MFLSTPSFIFVSHYHTQHRSHASISISPHRDFFTLQLILLSLSYSISLSLFFPHSLAHSSPSHDVCFSYYSQSGKWVRFEQCEVSLLLYWGSPCGQSRTRWGVFLGFSRWELKVLRIERREPFQTSWQTHCLFPPSRFSLRSTVAFSTSAQNSEEVSQSWSPPLRKFLPPLFMKTVCIWRSHTQVCEILASSHLVSNFTNPTIPLWMARRRSH